MKDSCWIPDDGYTESGYVEAKPGLHGEFRFTYRPLLTETRSRLLRSFDNLKAEEQDLIVAKTLAERVASWSLTKQSGEAVPVAVDNVRRLKPAIFFRLWSVVLGTEPSDLDPAWETEQKVEAVTTLLEAAAAPAPVGVVREAGNEKNSGGA